jgi:predicted alpha/beta superfamily hydrolase
MRFKHLVFLLFFVLLSRQFLFAQTPTVNCGRIERIESFFSKYVLARTVDVWLPNNYDSTKRYAVWYMHDGQMLFDGNLTWNKQEWRIDETLCRLINEQALQGIIVVGVHNIGEKRYAEYFPQKALNFVEDYYRDSILLPAMQAQPLADNYLKFLVEELKPYVDSLYFTNPEAEATFTAGASMGGLISFYAVNEYPNVFGGAACFSTHWPGIKAHNKVIPKAFSDYFFSQQKSSDFSFNKFYFVNGDQTLDAMYPRYQKDIRRMFAKAGYDKNRFKQLTIKGADHSEKSWASQFEDAFRFLMETK